ncbi:hypothetical protein ABN763_02805 [Spongiivirga sp. MCCC 1A20706]|uniref:hypothetical protein n=1 Tax=Spongiivirga sp. MCCC 1A20706 TaxID=3160963 RepID=UPI003977C542
MIKSDWALLEEIKQKIVADVNLHDAALWSQKDFDFLSYFIEEKTTCRLSISTLKRIWSNSHQRLPHISTLNALSKTAFNKDWQTFKSESLSNSVEKKDGVSKGTFVGQGKKIRKTTIGLLLIIPIILMLLGDAKTLQNNQYAEKKVDDVTFGYRKTLKNQLPNTVVFTYDIDAIDADRFFLQQSWDTSRKVEIFKGNKERTDIYYIPGYFTAKLFADNQIIKEMPVHVIYENWFIAARQPMSRIVTFDKELWLRKDYLGIDKETLEKKGIDVHREFQLAYYFVKDFEVDGNNLTYKASFKMDPLESVDCPIMNIHLQGTNDFYWIMIGNKGCGSELAVRVGDVMYNGKIQDLTSMTTNMYQWNDFEIRTIDKNVIIKLNGKEVFSTTYENTIGGIMEISYFFNGLGMIDDVELTDGQGEIKFSDDLKYRSDQVR